MSTIMTSRVLLIAPLLLLPLAGSPARQAHACAPASAHGTRVEIASESAIIIWDEKNQTQHFIRRASFITAATGNNKVSDFGFLVPTPTRPKITEAEDKAFDALAQITAPKIEIQSRPAEGERSGSRCGCGSSPTSAAAGGAGAANPRMVNVLEENRVGNLDYKILQATNAQALTDWLNERAYEIRPALTRWLEQYVTKGWIITAFKINKDENREGAATRAVCMSFQTPQPIFPYREPDDMADAKGKRLLRVYFIGDGKAHALHGAMQWVGKIAWAGKPNDDQWKTVVPHMNQPGFEASGLWLTEFEDPSSPRPGNNDITFGTKGSDQNPVERPPTIVYASLNSDALPTWVGFAAIVFCLALVRMTRRPN